MSTDVKTAVKADVKRVDVRVDDVMLRAFWGHGIATQALTAFLWQVETRPLDPHVAKDHLASLRVLQTYSFVITGED